MRTKNAEGRRPKDLGRTLGTFLSYLGRHKVLIALVGVLAAVSAVANLLGTYMIKPVVQQIMDQGSLPGLVAMVAPVKRLRTRRVRGQ